MDRFSGSFWRFVNICVILLLLMLGGHFSAAQTEAAAVDTLQLVLNTPLCPDAFALAPENPAFIHFNQPVTYQWEGEPGGVARREWVAFNVTLGDEGTLGVDALFYWLGHLESAPATPNSSTHTLAGNFPGTYNWTVMFYDVQDDPICRLNTYWLDVRAGGGSQSQFESAPAAVIAQCNGLFVVVLQNSPFVGAANLVVGADNYDGSAQALNGCTALEIHGNNAANILTGGTTNDVIFGYDGNDTINGGEGDDQISGGAGSDLLFGDTGSDSLEGGEDADEVYGGSNNAGGGTNNDVGFDTITDTGASGNNTIYGGNNNQNGGTGDDGDDVITVNSSGNDKIYGGNNNQNNGQGDDGSDILGSFGGSDSLFGGNDNQNSGQGNDTSDTLNAVDGALDDWVVGGNNNVGTGTGVESGANNLLTDGLESFVDPDNFP